MNSAISKQKVARLKGKPKISTALKAYESSSMGIFQSIEEANNTSERLLRSEIKNSHGEFEKFDFDTEEYEINPKRKLRLVSRINPNAGHLRKSKSCFTVDEHVDETRCQKPVMKSPFMSNVDDEIKKRER